MEVDQSDYEEGGDVSSDDDYSPGSLVIDTEGVGECVCGYVYVCVCVCILAHMCEGGGHRWVGVCERREVVCLRYVCHTDCGLLRYTV